jgi:hypothetical protein
LINEKYVILRTPDIDEQKAQFIECDNGYKLWSKRIRVSSLIMIATHYVDGENSIETAFYQRKLKNALIMMSYPTCIKKW